MAPLSKSSGRRIGRVAWDGLMAIGVLASLNREWKKAAPMHHGYFNIDASKLKLKLGSKRGAGGNLFIKRGLEKGRGQFLFYRISQ